MFERFTDRARRVLVLAQEEARQLNHSFIGTEHVLLGLVHEGDGVAAQALGSLGITLESARAKVTEIIGVAEAAPGGSPPFTPRAKKVLELSLREALQLGHNYIGTEHILLGVVREGEGVAAQVLVGLGADLPRVRQEVIRLLSGYPGGHVPEAGSGPASEPGAGPMSRAGLRRAGPTEAEPTCGRCGARLAEVACYRMMEVPPSADEARRDPLTVAVVFCTRCGTLLGPPAPSIFAGGPGGRARRAGVGQAPVARRARRFPDDQLDPVDIDAVADAARVELVYRDHEVMEGTVAGTEVQLRVAAPSHHGSASGTFSGSEVAATWDLDDNSSSHPEPGGSLAGHFGDEAVSVRGRFHLDPGFFFDRAHITGALGARPVELDVTAAEGGLGSTNTVVIDGTVGETAFDLSAALSGDLTRAKVRGTVGDRPVRLDASKVEPATVRIVGAYEGPSALLAVIVGSLVYFL